MNSKSILSGSGALAGLALLALSGPVSADSTWYTTGCADGSKTCTYTADGVVLNVTAYSSDASNVNFSNSGSALSTLEQWTGGIGVISADPNDSDESSGSYQPDHAIDNDMYPGADYNEMVHLSFSAAVDLASVTAGWTYTDSDAMIFRWNDSTTGPTVSDYSPNELPTSVNGTSSGWTLVAASAFAGYNTSGQSGTINIANSAFSSHWLVSTAFGGASDGKDGFKLKSFTAAIKPPDQGGSVPEPGTLSLALLGALGWFGSKRLKGARLRQQPVAA